LLDVLDRYEHVRRKRRTDRFEIVGQIAVVVDRVDDGLADRRRARVEIFELELPQKVIAQRLFRSVGVLDGSARVRTLRGFGWAGLLRVAPLGLGGDRDLDLGLRFRGVGVILGLVRVGRPLPRSRSLRPRA
jgi:hypothetical protein